jgi:hypothetical protein
MMSSPPPGRQAARHEWAVAQELFRSAALRGQAEPGRVPHGHGGGHQLDLVVDGEAVVEVKRGRATALGPPAHAGSPPLAFWSAEQRENVPS